MEGVIERRTVDEMDEVHVPRVAVVIATKGRPDAIPTRLHFSHVKRCCLVSSFFPLRMKPTSVKSTRRHFP
jgi:hypothetical protein